MELLRKRCSYYACAVCVAMLVSSCAPGERPFLQTQLCVADAHGMDVFKQTLQNIAREERMRYIDSSEVTMRDLRNLNESGSHLHLDGHLVNVGIEDRGYGLTAGNVGLNTYDVSVGFGPATRESRAFAERVVARLRQKWALKVLPKDSGAFPDPGCTGKAETPPNNSSKPTPLRGAA